MAANTGRTVSKWFKFQLEDSGGTFRDFGIDTINGVGIEYDAVEMSAIQDVFHGFLPGWGTTAIDITGKFSNKAAATASVSGESAATKLTGSHTLLNPLAGGVTPLGFAAYFGIRHDWETGEPVFGLASSAANGILVVSYVVSGDLTYSATLQMYPGSATPAWGTAVIS